MTLYYLPAAANKGKLWKLLVYSALDILRGLAFTMGGLYQLGKSLGKKVM